MDTSSINMYTSFYLERNQSAVCGAAYVNGMQKSIQFVHKPGGDYLNGLLEILIADLRKLNSRSGDWRLHLEVHVHHKNKNFKTALDKVIKAADTARCYETSVRDNIIKHTLTRKDYHKPNCYERMADLARALIDVNDPVYRVTLTTCGDSRSPDQLAVYTACQGAWNDLRAARNAGAADVPVEATAN